MRAWLVAAAMSMLAWAPVVAAGEEDPESWVPWSVDPQEVPAPLPADLKAVEMAATTTQIHLRFTTHNRHDLPAAVSSEVRFEADQARQWPVQFEWDVEPRLWVDGQEVLEGWELAKGSGPEGWHLKVQWDALGIAAHRPFALRHLDAVIALVVSSEATQGLVHAGAWSDRGTGPDLELTPEDGELAVSVAGLQEGTTFEGPDYGGGASVTVDAHGEPLVAYYIYDEGRGTVPGIYLARVPAATRGGDMLTDDVAAFEAERIADAKVSREDGGRDEQMRTQVAHDGKATFVLFTDDPAVDNDEDGPGHPGTPDSVYVVASDNGWKREDPTPHGKSDVGPEDVADLVARRGRVVAAVPVGDDVWVVERTGPGAWRQVARLPGATNAKLAIDSTGTVHAAYVDYGSEEGSWREGKLYYASSRDGFKAVHVGDNIDSGWEEPETDGSFAIAVGLADEVAVLWNDGRAEREGEQKLAILRSGAWTYDTAPLRPGHGNPQYTMRLGFTAVGHLVAASGYGGTDSLAVRGPNGGWVRTELPRFDVWDMAVSPAGQVYFAYTQPHGGTTVALSVYHVSPAFAGAVASGPGDAGPPPVGAAADARLAPGLGAAAVLGLVAAALRWRRGPP